MSEMKSDIGRRVYGALVKTGFFVHQPEYGDLHGVWRERFETAIFEALGQSLPRGFEQRLQIAESALRRVSVYGPDSAGVASLALKDMQAIPLGEYFNLRENESSVQREG